MDFIFVIAILIMSVVIHEVAHGYAALYLGDRTAQYAGRLTLNPIKHLDLIGSVIVPILGYLAGGVIFGWAKPVPFNPYNLRSQRWGEAIVAAAGPLSNLALAIIFGLLIRFATFGSQAFYGLAGYLVLVNIVLFVFNLIPIPPLDGSKILFSILPYRMQGIRIALERYGLILALLFIFFLWQAMSPVVASIFSLIVG
jgi:Zn-dependent protease